MNSYLEPYFKVELFTKEKTLASELNNPTKVDMPWNQPTNQCGEITDEWYVSDS